MRSVPLHPFKTLPAPQFLLQNTDSDFTSLFLIMRQYWNQVVD